jgi:hypothetical protein
MSANIFFDLRPRPLSLSGQIMPGCYYQFYESETTTPTPVYADADLETPLDNPLVADADGRFPVIYMDASVVYRVQLYDADDVLQYDADPVHPHSSVPPGTLVMFHGTEEDRDDAYPPALWEVCDGDNGTPDSRDRSPVGVSNTKSIGDTGGSATATTSEAGAVAEGATGETELGPTNMPKHTHRLFAFNTTNVDGRVDGFALGGNDVSVAGERNAGGAYITDNGFGTQLIEDSGSDDVEGHDHTIPAIPDHTHDVDTQSPYFVTWFLKRKS